MLRRDTGGYGQGDQGAGNHADRRHQVTLHSGVLSRITGAELYTDGMTRTRSRKWHRADLLPVDGDPLANIRPIDDPARNLVVIMKDGRICTVVLT